MKRTIIMILAIAFMLVGCNDPNIGIQIKRQNHAWLNDDGGHHNVVLKHIIIDYDYKIEDNKIYFNGNINCNDNNVNKWDNAYIKLRIGITDSRRYITSSYTYTSLSTEDFCESKSFVMDYPYPEGSAGVGFGYNIKLWQ